MTLQVINREAFKSLSYPIVFENVKTDRCYALLKDNQNTFKLSWASDLLTPSIIAVQPGVCAIGIDEHFAVIDFNSKQIAINIELSFPFHEARIVSSSIVLACELEVLIIDIDKYHIMERLLLPDIYCTMDLKGNKVEITCMDGNITSVQIR